MGGGNVCKSNSARKRNEAKLAGQDAGGGGRAGTEKRTGDTAGKIADATLEREKAKLEKEERERIKAKKAEAQAKKVAKVNAK